MLAVLCCRWHRHPGVYKNARDWLMSAKGLTEDQAITLLTVGCDFNVHQVRPQQRHNSITICGALCISFWALPVLT